MSPNHLLRIARTGQPVLLTLALTGFWVLGVAIPNSPSRADLLSDLALSRARATSERVLRTIVAPRILSWDFLEAYRDIARLHVSSNEYNDPLKVNEPYNGQGTYLYITKPSRASELPSQLRNNCTSLLGTRAIVCDGAYLESIGRCMQDPNFHQAAPRDPDIQEVILGLMRIKGSSLLHWIIGHEVGHIANGDTLHPPSGGWTSPGPNSKIVLGTSAEISADEYAFRSMFRRENESTRTMWGFFPQTIGLLAYHMRLDNAKNEVFYNSTAHPPMVARLFNAWWLYKRDYDDVFRGTLSSDDEAILDKVRSIQWRLAASPTLGFCERSDASKASYDYSILPGSPGRGYELMRALLWGWIYRDPEWSRAVLREVADQAPSLREDSQLGNPSFVGFLEDLNKAVFARSGQLPAASQALIERVAASGLVNAEPATSDFAQILAVAVRLGSGAAGAGGSMRAKEQLERFDAIRQHLKSVSLTSKDETATVGLSLPPTLLILNPAEIGSSEWRRLTISILRDADEGTVEGITNYLAAWVERSGFLSELSAGQNSEKAALQWTAVDTLYVSSFLGSYGGYILRNKQRQLDYAIKSRLVSAVYTWQTYYEVADRSVAQQPDEAIRLARAALAALQTNDGRSPSGLPIAPFEWMPELELRFRNIVGWALTRQGRYADAIEVLTPALASNTLGCIWLRPHELCVDGIRPTIVFVLDNLAASQLGVGDAALALRISELADAYRDRQRATPGFEGFASDALIYSAEIKAAALFNAQPPQSARAVELVRGIGETVAQVTYPQRPARDKFVVTFNGKPFDLLSQLPQLPTWARPSDLTSLVPFSGGSP